MATMRCLAVMGVAVAGLALAFPYLIDGGVRLVSCPYDAVVGNVEPVESKVLADRFKQKKTLVVGATRGIGRGIALALAKAGADVRIVGRSREGGAAVVTSMSSLAPSKSQQFKAYSYDLSTVKECLRFTNELREEGVSFDYVILTVGVWPDFKEPNTADGINKVIALDLVARFAIMEGVAGLMPKGARVMSVLASTFKMPAPSVEDLQAIISGNKTDPGFGELLSTAALSNDALLQEAAKRHASLSFIGTHPGFVVTDLPRSTFPPLVANMMALAMKPMAASEEECGEVHANILSSPNAGRRQASYFNYLLDGREAMPLAYDSEYGKWVWAHMEGLLLRHK